jgi:hypothetical protein
MWTLGTLASNDLYCIRNVIYEYFPLHCFPPLCLSSFSFITLSFLTSFPWSLPFSFPVYFISSSSLLFSYSSFPLLLVTRLLFRLFSFYPPPPVFAFPLCFLFLFGAHTHATVSSGSGGITVRQCCHTEISQTLRSLCAKLWRPDKTCYRYLHKRIQHASPVRLLHIATVTPFCPGVTQPSKAVRSLRFWRLRGFILWSSGLWHRIVWQVGSKVLE